MTDRAGLAGQITLARQGLVSTLATLEPADWEAPTLCEEWAVRDVVGHLLHQYAIYRLHPPLGFARAGFRVNRYLSDAARRVARGRSPSDLLQALEAAAYERAPLWRVYPWPTFALAEFVIHGQDIRRPFGIAHVFPGDQLVPVANVFARTFRVNPFRIKLPDSRWEATDAVWSAGEGPLVRGPLEAIVMVLAGRRHALSDLSGEGVAQLEGAL